MRRVNTYVDTSNGRDKGLKKKRILIAAGIIAAAVIAVVAVRIFSGNQEASSDGNIAYVEEVANLKDTGMIGMVNRYAGVIEAQETWSVNQNSEVSVQEIKVAVGDEVKKGDVLFVYNTEKYESDLAQANIDLERLNNEVVTIQTTIDQLTTEKNKAAASEQGNYTVQIQEQQLQLQEKQLDIQSKQVEIDKLQDNIENAEVVSEIDGVVKSINDGTSVNTDSTDTSFITVMKTGDLRVKGSVNEQNIGMLYEGMTVIVHSRVDTGKTWTGTISKVDTENANSNQSSYYYSDSGSSSTSYPFYVDLDDSSELMLGQHVYIEPDLGTEETVDKSEGIWIGSYYVDQTDESHPFVWAADSKGKLEKREVTLGETDELYYEVQILDGLTDEDQIAIPDDTYEVGMTTTPMSEMTFEYDESVTADSTWDEAEYSDEYELSENEIEDNDESQTEEADVSGEVIGGNETDGVAVE